MTTRPAPAAPARMIGVLFGLLAATAWGTTGTAATFAPEVPAVAIGAAAMGIGGMLQALIAIRGIRSERGALLRHRRPLLVGAICVAIYPLAFYASMRLAGVTIGTVISIGSAPLISALIENRVEGTRLTLRWGIGAALGIGGMALLGAMEGNHEALAPNVPLGVALGLLAGMTYALYAWCARRLMQHGIEARAAMGATFGLGGLLLMPVLFAAGDPFLDSASNLMVGIYMATVPMFLGYVAFGIALSRLPSSQVTTLTLFEPVVAALLAIAVVGERLPPLGWLGVGLIIACLFWNEAPLPRRRTRRTRTRLSALRR
ncbi:DMT family transporter [Profundibacterium mesophilum]|uniref:Transporter DME family DMT superfamily protein n=1 Tax=Profundibacterium mesophilum KAUST100406-0324 TaxID=1037889 RepID=A0A921NUS5_9RHOB|nr:EamA family transporter [Profundibacterium mesophilum]KAF0675963.1 putative transporter DME family DMT superfamily protein [Profundibacterium mesophilum KAUST100406-0324]